MNEEKIYNKFDPKTMYLEDNKNNHYNILDLVKKSNYKRIMVKKYYWGRNNYAIIHKIYAKKGTTDRYCSGVYAYTHYANGNTLWGGLPGHNNFKWELIKIFDEDIKTMED